MRIYPLGDCALVVEVGEQIDELTHDRVQRAWRALQDANLPGVIELVPAYTSVTVFYDLLQLADSSAPSSQQFKGFEWLEERVRTALAAGVQDTEPLPGRLIEIPVCYGGEFGPDLEEVARQTNLSCEEVCRVHRSAEYFVHLLGFSPGFPYMGGLPETLTTARRAKPRAQVPPGSVAIAGRQAGIYPIVTPGGWNLIGRTPLKLFHPDRDPPSLLLPGDRVRFRSISAKEFSSAKGTPEAAGL